MQWERVEEVFAAALELPDAERADYVGRACGDDAELRDEVMTLLANASGASEALHAAVAITLERVEVETKTEVIGQRMGVYRIERELGEGGMGAVYLAARDDAEYRAHVAIKVLHHASAHAVARFRDERQILASLDHPGIVRLLDGGTTEIGTPYLVMDYIAGQPLTRYVRTHALSIDDRLALFRQVCAAVQYAHQRLIVHRDLKPSNILVDDSGAAHLLDFGIAKLLDAERGEREAKTLTGMPMLTPEYASPEQARGEHVATAADVYSLGAVLYELLCDTPPVRRTQDPLEQLRRICEVEPARPSTVAPAADRAQLSGDLDNIVLKALHKEPARRYASVEQLSDDLGRYLGGLPVAARPATFGYRASKLVRRHRGKLAAAVLAATALTVATVFSVVQARRAERRLGDIRGLASSLLFELDAKIRYLPGATEARELVVTRALEYLDRLARDSSGDSSLEREIAVAYMKVGDIQGNMYEPNLGRPLDGIASYGKARALLDQTPAADLETRVVDATWRYGLAFLEQTNGKLELARIDVAKAIEVASHLDLHTLDRTLVMRGYIAGCELEILTGNILAAKHYAVDFLAVSQKSLAPSGDDPDGRYWITIANELGGRVDDLLGDPPAAIASLRASIDELVRLRADHPNDVRFGREESTTRTVLAGAYGGIGDKWSWTTGTGELDLAEREEQLSVDGAERAGDPLADSRTVLEHATYLVMLAGTIARRDPARAVPVFDRALALWASASPSVRSAYYNVQLEWFAHCAVAEPYAIAGRRDEAIAEAARGLALLQGVPADSVGDELLQCKYLVARARHVLGDDVGAGELADEVLAGLDARFARKSYDMSNYMGAMLTLDLLAEVRPHDACSARRRAVAMWNAWPGPPTRFIRDRAAVLEAAAASCAR